MADPRATVADLVAALAPSPGDGGRRSLRIERTGAVPAPLLRLGDVDLRSGDRIAVVEIDETTVLDAGLDRDAQPHAELRVLTGPMAGARFRLSAGTITVGRAAGNDLVLADPGISRNHATIDVDANAVVVTDLGSTNRIQVEGVPIDGPTTIRSGQRLLLGQSWVAVDHRGAPVIPIDGRVAFDPPPRSVVPPIGQTFVAPAPPDEARTTGRLASLGGRSPNRQLVRAYEQAIDQLVADLDQARRREREARGIESPSVDDVVLAVRARTRLWERRPTDPDVLHVRLGLAELTSRLRIETTPGGPVDLRRRVDRLPATYATIDGVPAVVDLGRPDGLTLRGERTRTVPVASALVAQLVGLNPPGQVGVVLCGERLADWDWLKWLPHADVDGSGPPSGAAAIDLVRRRLAADPPAGGAGSGPAHLVVIVDRPGIDLGAGVDGGTQLSDGGRANGNRPSLLEQLRAAGPARGLHPLVLEPAPATSAERPPSLSHDAGAVLDLRASTGRLSVPATTADGVATTIDPLLVEGLTPEAAAGLGRLLAALVPGPGRAPTESAGRTRSRSAGVDEGNGRAPDRIQGRAEGGGGAADDDAGTEAIDGLVRVEPLTLGPAGAGDGPDRAADPSVGDPGVADGPDRAADPGGGDPGVGGHERSPDPGAPLDLFTLPRSRGDSRLVLGQVVLPDATETVLAFNPPRDGTLALIGPPGSERAGCLLTVAAAAARLGVASDRRPLIYAFGDGSSLDGLAALPLTTRLVGDDPAQAIEALAAVEQRLDDRLVTFELAGSGDLERFREARPDVGLRRVLVLIDGLSRLTSLLEPGYPGRTREVVGQLLEIGSGLGVHLVMADADRSQVDPLLVPKVGRWLEMDGSADRPGRFELDGAAVRIAVPGGSWDLADINRTLAELGDDLESEGAEPARSTNSHRTTPVTAGDA